MGSSRPTVSVIIPTFNRAGSLPEALETVLSQVPFPDEIIVVDDGSQDNTQEVLASYKGLIKVVYQENAGAAAARNTGMKMASGDWLAFLDSDDLWTPNRMASLHRDLEVADAGVIAHTGDLQMTGAGYDVGLFSHRGWDIPMDRAEQLDYPLRRTLSGLPLPATAIERKTALACGGLPEEMPIYEDLAFLSRVALKGAWLFTGDTMAQARRLEGDDTALSNIERLRPHLAASVMANFMTDFLNEEKMSPIVRTLAARHTSGALFTLANVEARNDPAAARYNLWRSARIHPHPIKGYLKIIAPLVLGRRGFEMILRQNRDTFTRS